MGKRNRLAVSGRKEIYFKDVGELTKSPGGPRTRFSRWAGMREAGQQDTRGAAQRGPSSAAAAPEPGRHSEPHIHTGTQNHPAVFPSREAECLLTLQSSHTGMA